LAEEVTRIAEKTQFNTETLLAGGLKDDGAVTIQIGANKGETLSIEIGTMTAAKLSVSGLVVSTSHGLSQLFQRLMPQLTQYQQREQTWSETEQIGAYNKEP